MSEQVSAFQVAVSLAAAVIVFVYALKAFSKDIQETGGERLSLWLGRVTESPVKGFVLGALLTALVQSSSAVSGITVALVEAGTILFRSSLPIFLGANVGTTSTAWLVSLKLEFLGSFLIVASVPIAWLPGRISLAARSVFFLGVILLALQLISAAIGPVKSDPAVAQWLAYAKVPAIGLLTGIVGTALLQSSSVMVGLAIIAVQQGLLTAEQVIPVVIGSNVGTTSTALIASMNMGAVAKRAATANLIFNALGVIVFLPVMMPFGAWVVAHTQSGDTAVAVAHLIFNIVVAIVGFLILNPLARWLSRGTQ